MADRPNRRIDLRSSDDARRARDLRRREILPFAGADARILEFGEAGLQSIRNADLTRLALNGDRESLGALGQIALAHEWRPERLREALNFHLKPHPVVVVAAAPVPEGWNARFSARAG